MTQAKLSVLLAILALQSGGIHSAPDHNYRQGINCVLAPPNAASSSDNSVSSTTPAEIVSKEELTKNLESSAIKLSSEDVSSDQAAGLLDNSSPAESPDDRTRVATSTQSTKLRPRKDPKAKTGDKTIKKTGSFKADGVATGRTTNTADLLSESGKLSTNRQGKAISTPLSGDDREVTNQFQLLGGGSSEESFDPTTSKDPATEATVSTKSRTTGSSGIKSSAVRVVSPTGSASKLADRGELSSAGKVLAKHHGASLVLEAGGNEGSSTTPKTSSAMESTANTDADAVSGSESGHGKALDQQHELLSGNTVESEGEMHDSASDRLGARSLSEPAKLVSKQNFGGSSSAKTLSPKPSRLAVDFGSPSAAKAPSPKPSAPAVSKFNVPGAILVSSEHDPSQDFGTKFNVTWIEQSSQGAQGYVWEELTKLRGRTSMSAGEIQELFARAVPGSDYPSYTWIPSTKFSCNQVNQPGFYADPEARCQVIRRCDINGIRWNYLCPNGTLFNQITLVCDWFFNIDCSKAVQYYDYSNSRLYHSDWLLLDTPPEAKA